MSTALAARLVRDHWARYLVAGILTLAIIFPFYWMVVISLGTLQSVFVFPPYLYPLGHFENFVTAWDTVPWPRYFFNTILVAIWTTALVLITSTLAGYAFASMRFPGKGVIFGFVLAIYMVPTEVTLVPNFITLKTLGWIDTYQAQVLPYAASVFGVFLMRQFFLTLPKELWEAAQLEACSHLRFLWSIAVPLARAPLVTIALFHIVGAWNSFLWPLIVTTSDSVRPIQVGLTHYQYNESTDPTLLAAGALIATLPIMALFIFAQRYVVGGFASSGIRG